MRSLNIVGLLAFLAHPYPVKAEVAPEASILYGLPFQPSAHIAGIDINRKEKTGLLEIAFDIKDTGRRIFPYVTYATWKNVAQAGNQQSQVFLVGVGFQTVTRPVPGDFYLEFKAGAGMIGGKNVRRFQGTDRMFQFKAMINYQVSKALSLGTGIAHFSNGNVIFDKGKRDIGRNYITFGISSRF